MIYAPYKRGIRGSSGRLLATNSNTDSGILN